MKLSTPLKVSITLSVLMCFAQSLFAQSVTMSLVGTSFCSGDPVAVDIRVNGPFGKNNAFTLQLSDTSGNFKTNFHNIGAIMASTSGTYRIDGLIPVDILPGKGYRIRIIAAKPPQTSADNGTNISIGARPLPVTLSPLIAQAGNPLFDSVKFEINRDARNADSIIADFGVDAFPRTVAYLAGQWEHLKNVNVVYTTAGLKTVTIRETSVTGSCSTVSTFTVDVKHCDAIQIPPDAIVLYGDEIRNDHDVAYWVNPGVKTEISGENNIIFAEPGSLILMNNSGIVYLKAGAELTVSTNSLNVIMSDSASINGYRIDGVEITKCSSLQFDYSKAPPNLVVNPLRVSRSNLQQINLVAAPNPTQGVVTIKALPARVSSISLQNILGAKVMDVATPRSSEATIDLSKLNSGVYYLRVVSAEGVATKKIVRK